MDQGRLSTVWLALALLQGVLIVSAFRVGHMGPREASVAR